jgi:hypothetical protein
MNLYKVITECSIYGKNEFNTKAHTPYDAAEKAENRMSWRHQEDIIKQTVIILDGSKQQWEFITIRRVN